MTKQTYTFKSRYELIAVIKAISKEFGKPNVKFSDNGKFEILDKDKKKIASAIITGEEKIEVDGIKLKKVVESVFNGIKEIKPLTDKEIKDSLFPKAKEQEHMLNGIINSPTLFRKYNKKLKELGISNIIMGTPITSALSISKELTLAINCDINSAISDSLPNGFETRLKKSLFEGLDNEAQDYNALNAVRARQKVREFKDEKVTEINMVLPSKNTPIVGRYYNDRNLIHLYINPFDFKKIVPLITKKIQAMDLILNTLITIKVKQQDITDLERKLFITSFMSGQQKQLREIENRIRDITMNIGQNESDLKSNIKYLHDNQVSLNHIERMLEGDGSELFDEIEETKKLSFITKVELKSDTICLSFRPTTITTDDFAQDDHGKKFGPRTFYLGAITIMVSPNRFEVKNADYMINNHAHPHSGGGDNVPCFGSGPGRNKIYELLACNKFSEVASMLWFWIRTYRNNSAHCHHWTWYNECLKQGIPVWDEKGKRIKINDEARIKTGEQKKLEPYSQMNDNLVKYKSEKMEG